MRSPTDILAKVRENLGNRLRVAEAHQRVFDTPDGKLVLHKILKEGFVLKSTFVVGDPYQTALNEGSRRLALAILRQVYRDIDKMYKQVEESIRKEQESDE